MARTRRKTTESRTDRQTVAEEEEEEEEEETMKTEPIYLMGFATR
jgi:hypothetical protein